MQPLRRGDAGAVVAEIRATLAQLGLLDAVEPPLFDAACELAVRAFQQQRGLTCDGRVGAETYRALSSARWRLGDRVLLHSITAPMMGDDVFALQERLLELGYDPDRPDGIFGARTAEALARFQRDYGMPADGSFGPLTMRAFRQLGRKVTGGRPQLLREDAHLHHRGPSLLGKKIVIDPGHGGSDPGATAAGERESVLVWDLASRLEGRLEACGVTAYLTRGPNLDGPPPTDVERAGLANDIGADLLISLHCDRHASPLAEGVATFHFGNGAISTVGERFAGLAQREIVARTGLRDCRTHPKTWDLLRLTRMPAVRVELGYLSSPTDLAKLSDPSFRDTVAEALLAACQRLYLPADIDPPTGTLRLPAELSR
jgi:N-acetylmuramoyl-L-alanine amidase